MDLENGGTVHKVLLGGAMLLAVPLMTEQPLVGLAIFLGTGWGLFKMWLYSGQ